MLKRVTRLGDTSLRHCIWQHSSIRISPPNCARATQLHLKKCRRGVGNTVSDLTGPRFEPQTSRSRDEHTTTSSTGHFQFKQKNSWETKIIIKITTKNIALNRM